MSQNSKTYVCGTLKYSSFGLLMVCFWLMVGFFVFILTTAVVPAIMPLKLKMLHASDTSMGIILTTIGGILNVIVRPIVNFKSDRYRSRWGRRIPFIILTLPMMCLAWLLFAYVDDIGALLYDRIAWLARLSPTTVVIWLIAGIIFIYQFFLMFVGSVIFYIFNDVIPTQFLARFMGFINVASTGAQFIFQYFIFKYAETYFSWIMIGTCIIYAIGVGLMCLLVKEPVYPPLSEADAKGSKGLEGIITFLKESYTAKFYWVRYGISAFAAASAAIVIYMVFFYQNLGFTLDQIGKLNGAIQLTSVIAGVLISSFCAFLIDKWHPMRISAYSSILGVVLMIWYWKWLFFTVDPMLFIILFVALTIFGALPTTLGGISYMPMYMLIFPKSRFGQFCSSDALVRSFATIVFGTLAGVFIDVIRSFPAICPTENYAYRYFFLWQFIFNGIVCVLYYISFRQWLNGDGLHGFRAPAIWEASGYEKLDASEIIGTRKKPLLLSIYIFDLCVICGIAAIFGLSLFCKAEGFPDGSRDFLSLALPFNVFIGIVWLLVRRTIMRDIRLVSAGKLPINGLPHHGMMLLFAGKHLLLIGLAIFQSIMIILMGAKTFTAESLPGKGQIFSQISVDIAGRDWNSVLAWLCDCSMLLVVIFAVYVVCRMERGALTTFYEKKKESGAEKNIGTEKEVTA